jgi:hypothetical protein
MRDKRSADDAGLATQQENLPVGSFLRHTRLPVLLTPDSLASRIASARLFRITPHFGKFSPDADCNAVVLRLLSEPAGKARDGRVGPGQSKGFPLPASG